MGTSKPSVVETDVARSAGLNASLADVGLMVPSHAEIAGLGVVGLLLQRIHLYSKSGVLDRGLVFLGEVKLCSLEARVELCPISNFLKVFF